MPLLSCLVFVLCAVNSATDYMAAGLECLSFVCLQDRRSMPNRYEAQLDDQMQETSCQLDAQWRKCWWLLSW